MSMDRLKVQRGMEDAARWPGRLSPLTRDCIMNLRILEYEGVNGHAIFGQLMTVHRCVETGRRVGICRRAIFGLPCAFCKANQRARSASRAALFIAQPYFVVNAIDIDVSSTLVGLFVIPMSVFKRIAEYALTDKWKHVLEAEYGHAFAIGRKGEGLATRYSVKMHHKAYPVGKDIAEGVVNPITGIKDESYKEQLKVVSHYKWLYG